MRIAIFLLLLLVSLSALGQVHKCKNADGGISYQQEACGPTQETQKTPYLPPAPASTVVAIEESDGPEQQNPALAERLAGTQQPVASTIEHPHGLGVSAYSDGHINAVRCTRANGTTYVATGGCGSSPTQSGYEAFDAQTGRPLNATSPTIGGHPIFDTDQGRFRSDANVQWRPAYKRSRDSATSMSPDEACGEAQRTNSRNTDALCRQGRSMYDIKPSANSLYNKQR